MVCADHDAEEMGSVTGRTEGTSAHATLPAGDTTAHRDIYVAGALCAVRMLCTTPTHSSPLLHPPSPTSTTHLEF